MTVAFTLLLFNLTNLYTVLDTPMNTVYICLWIKHVFQKTKNLHHTFHYH